MISEQEHLAGFHGHKLSIKLGGNPTMGKGSEFREISDTPKHIWRSGKECPFDLALQAGIKIFKYIYFMCTNN